MKKTLILLAVGFQILVLVWMVSNREWIVGYGETVYLRTAPIDPRDIFRGDFVRLNYDFSQLSRRQLPPALATETINKADMIYVLLEKNAQGIAQMHGVTLEKPSHGRFIRGRATQHWTAEQTDTLFVKYGIEKYFVEQGKGLDMEQRRGTRNGIQLPLDIEIALDSAGTAVIKGHRWNQLGIGLRSVQSQPPADNENNNHPRPTSTFELTLQNASAQPLALALLPNDCSFSLAAINSAPVDIRLQPPKCAEALANTAAIIRLEPEETYITHFDFRQPHWHVAWQEQRLPISELPWNQRFRLVYRSPPSAQLPPTADNLLLWQGELSSTAFHGEGWID